MKKIPKKILLVFTAFLFLLSTRGAFAATGGYTYENVAFYAQSSSLGYVNEGPRFYAFDSQMADSLPIYQFYNSTNGDHFYTISETEKDTLANNSQSNYTLEGIRFYAFNSQKANSLPIYRFYNTNNGDHFYTLSETEKNTVINNPQWGYRYENIAFYAFDSQVTDSLPVYRFYKSTTGDHFYTISEAEKNNLDTAPVYCFYNNRNGDHFYTTSVAEKNSLINNPQSGYFYEGIRFYVFSSQKANSLPVYRFYNAANGDHFYTLLENEKTTIINNPQWGYKYEKIAFYAYPTQIGSSLPVYRFYNSTTGDHFYTISESEKNYLILPTLGPDISVGLWNYTRADIQGTPFKIQANKNYNIKNKTGAVIAQVAGGTITRVTYDADGNLKVYGSIADTLSNQEVSFDAADGDNTTMIFDVYRPNSSFDQYRGKIKVRYTDSSNIWVINTLPLEHYVWGDGELAGTGPLEHTKVMTMTYRTYGYWKVKYSTQYATYGFKVRSDSGSQVYSGYDWEVAHPNIRTAAEATRGVVATYANDVILAPYSSWTDGRTRSYQERWGSTNYPWCQSVADPYGNYNDSYWGNSTQTTTQLENAGNHMVGLSAHGSLRLAGSSYNWTHDRILKYYFTNINLTSSY